MDKRDLYLRRKYGITSEDYERMLKEQKGGCAICGSTPKKRRLAVDHNHKTGRIRGLLCFPCNYGIGWLKDNAKKAYGIACYIERDGKKQGKNKKHSSADGFTVVASCRIPYRRV